MHGLLYSCTYILLPYLMPTTIEDAHVYIYVCTYIQYVHTISGCPVYDPFQNIWRMCSMAFHAATNDNRTQVRSYCRGVVCRAVDPETRHKLFARLNVTEMASMRSFLDPPPKKGQTIKGSGDIGYILHPKNHTNEVVVQGSELHSQVHTHAPTQLLPPLCHVAALCTHLCIHCTNMYTFHVYCTIYVYIS
jgi:hypothetical protein